MTPKKWHETFKYLTAASRTVNEILEAVEEMNENDINRVVATARLRKELILKDNSAEDVRFQVEYLDLIVRVVGHAVPTQYNQPPMIMDGPVYLVPVSWVDDRTMDASVNGNIDRWIKNGMIGERHLKAARDTQLDALHLFEPIAINRRTAHVTTDSFIRLMETAGFK